MTATLVHTLVADGAPFDAEGNRIGDKGTSGVGSAKCACGWLSAELDTRKARKEAHNEHKTNPYSDEETGSVSIEYSGAAKHFWRSLSKGAVDFAGSIEGVTDAKADYKTNSVIVEGIPEALEQAKVQIPQLWVDAYAAMKEARKTDEELFVAESETKEQRYARYKAEQAWMLKFCQNYSSVL